MYKTLETSEKYEPEEGVGARPWALFAISSEHAKQHSCKNSLVTESRLCLARMMIGQMFTLPDESTSLFAKHNNLY